MTVCNFQYILKNDVSQVKFILLKKSNNKYARRVFLKITNFRTKFIGFGFKRTAFENLSDDRAFGHIKNAPLSRYSISIIKLIKSITEACKIITE